MVDAPILQYYDQFDENSRLNSTAGQLEFARTLELLLRYLPPPPVRILDMGGGTGPYSELSAVKRLRRVHRAPHPGASSLPVRRRYAPQGTSGNAQGIRRRSPAPR